MINDIGCCDICLENFNNNAKIPKILPCSHIVCLSCIKQYCNKPNIIRCPTCRNESPGFIQNLKTQSDIFKKYFFPCPNCQKQITKNELCLEDSIFKCTTCHKTSFPLIELLIYLTDDRSVLNHYKDITETDLSSAIDKMINDTVAKFFNSIIDNVKARLKVMFIENIKTKFSSYDILIQEKKVYMKIKELQRMYSDIEKFIQEESNDTSVLSQILKCVEVCSEEKLLDDTFKKVKYYITSNPIRISPVIANKDFEDLVISFIEVPFHSLKKYPISSLDDLIKQHLNVPKLNREMFNFISLKDFQKEPLIPFKLNKNKEIDKSLNRKNINNGFLLFSN